MIESQLGMVRREWQRI